MTVTVFLLLLTIFSTMTAVTVEAMKKFMDAEGIVYSSNIIALVVALILGTVGTGLYYVTVHIDFTLLNIAYMVLMGVANWIGAMVGYDKVRQAIEQIGGLK